MFKTFMDSKPQGKHTEADAPMDALPPPCLFGSPTADGLETRSPLEVQSVGAQRSGEKWVKGGWVKSVDDPWGLKVFSLLFFFVGFWRDQALDVFLCFLQKNGKSRILAMLAYLLRRVPHCGDFFAHPLGGATEAIWLHTVGSRSKASPDRKKRPSTKKLVVDGCFQK